MTAVDAIDDIEPRPTPPRWVLPAAGSVMIAVLVAGWIANSAWANWQHAHPLALIALSPLNRHLILTANDLPILEYYLVGLGRHLFPDPFFYALGFYYGDRALRWISEGNAVATKLVGADGRGLENPSHRRILYPLAFFMPNNWVSLFCGAARIPLQAFLVINIAGTTFRLVVCRWIAQVFAEEVETISDWIARYQWPITAVSVVFVLLAMSVQLRPGGAVRGISKLDD